jgi:ribosome biogenesis protein BMS1
MQAGAAEDTAPAGAERAALPAPPAPNGSSAAAEAHAGADFVPAASFGGARPGYAFKAGSAGLGYYREGAGVDADAKSGNNAAAGTGAPATAGALPGPPGGGGWVGMRTVAELRREAGVGAPRDADSLYRPIERAPRRFNPLKIPKALQARCNSDLLLSSF